MWVVAGILLGIVVLASLVGFHAGPHSHAVAGVVGIVAAAWLLVMGFTGQSAPLLWTLFGADLVVSTGVGVAAWKALTTPAPAQSVSRITSKPIGAQGVAVTDLMPDGIVRVRGESWSATCENGSVRAGTKVQVLEADGVRLRVWAEDQDGSSGLGLQGNGPAERLSS